MRKKILSFILMLGFFHTLWASEITTNLESTYNMANDCRNYVNLVFEKPNFPDRHIRNLVTTISLLSSEIKKLVDKYRESNNPKYVPLCGILMAIRHLCRNIKKVMLARKSICFIQFVKDLQKAVDRNTLLEIKVSFNNLQKYLTVEDKEIVAKIMHVFYNIKLPSKLRLISIARKVWKH